jgi:hypothetical protein
MAWYVVVIMIFTLGLVALEQVVRKVAPAGVALDGLPQDLVDVLSVVAPLAGFLVFFGFLSRRFERQADVYAARTIEEARGKVQDSGASVPEGVAGSPPACAQLGAASRSPDGPVEALPSPPEPSHVGPYGATVFASALHRVAVMNNIPVVPRRRPRRGLFRRLGHSLDMFVETVGNWFHGSVPHRMAYLRTLSTDPSLTHRFDRFMLRLYCTLLFVLFASAAFVFASSIR